MLGGSVKYTSKPYYHTGIGIRQYLSQHILDSKNPIQTSLTDSAGEDLNPLSELYLYYDHDDFFLKAGKQQLNTPLLNHDTTRLVPFSYRGLTAKFYLGICSCISVGYIDRFRFNNSETYTDITPVGRAENGIGYLGFNTVFGKVKHQWFYYHAPALYDAFHLQVESNTRYKKYQQIVYGVQGIYTFQNGSIAQITNRVNGGEDVRLLAAKLGLESHKFSYIGSLSYNFGGDGINRGYGGLSSLYTTLMISSGKKEGHPFAKSFKVRYTYYSPNKDKQYSSGLYFTNITYPENQNNTINALYIDHKFKFRPREYLLLRAEKQWIANASDKTYFRIISAYEF
ncbi:MAG TPA: hypothetical protein ENK72_00835 [Epsilonproteobacteria bacterium]|nr:hypothetical protein [Campylobacterota bacterium]